MDIARLFTTLSHSTAEPEGPREQRRRLLMLIGVVLAATPEAGAGLYHLGVEAIQSIARHTRRDDSAAPADRPLVRDAVPEVALDLTSAAKGKGTTAVPSDGGLPSPPPRDGATPARPRPTTQGRRATGARGARQRRAGGRAVYRAEQVRERSPLRQQLAGHEVAVGRR